MSAQTLNPDYQPTLPERMRNRVHAAVGLNVARGGGVSVD